MYCGNCFRDNALVGALRAMSHQVLMVPLYLPMTLDEDDQSAGTPIFFGGVNVYLEQKSALFRHAPKWLHSLLASPRLLKWAGTKAAKTRAEDVADLTLSMLRGEEGNQARELDELIAWLRTQPPPDVICLSNAMLAGLVRKLKSELRAPIVLMLQGEDYFLDAMPEPHRTDVWRTLAERAREADLFVAPSRYFADRMSARLDLPADKVRVVFNGINLDGYALVRESEAHSREAGPPVLGYFARMCKEKGLDLLADAFIRVKQRGKAANLRLRIGGGCGPGDEAFVEEQRARLRTAGVLGDVEFHPNLTREQKLEFFRSLTVFSVPALYGEAFGLYLIESLAAGVPVVQPRVAAFPELVEATGGGIVCEPDPAALAEGIESLLLDRAKASSLGDRGRHAVYGKFSVESMARSMAKIFGEACSNQESRKAGK
ncbi:MAG: glycosyltransferase family 4 protein [Verrucomicrobia bacterium]|nr:glycosyltransferase family 4 protein [Verrucomicrobiota bacterium]